MSCSDGATDASAENVVFRLVNSVAWVWATGATAPEKLSRPRRKPARSVLGDARFVVTGSRLETSGRNLPIARLMS